MTRRSHYQRLGGRVGAVLTTATFGAIAALGAGPLPQSQALPVPTSPDNPTISEEWANPNIRPNDGAEGITLNLLDGPSTLAENADLTVKLQVTNESDSALQGFTVTPRRGPVSASVADARAASVAEPTEYAAGETTSYSQPLEPGESTEIELSVHTDPSLAGSLNFNGEAVYPFMFVLARTDGGHLDSERFHIPVEGPVEAAQSDETAEQQQTTDVSMLYPITADTDILPGETGDAPNSPQLILGSEDLAADLAEGGRLNELVQTYADAIEQPGGEELSEAACLAIDPALVRTVERMSEGYVVAENRPPISQEPKRLRDSWGDDEPRFDSTPGTGSEDAQKWIEDLSAVAQESCVVALPEANADIDALSSTGSQWLVREAIERGPFTLRDILDANVVDNVVIPPSGYVSESSVEALGWADHANSEILDGGLQAAWEEAYDEKSSQQEGSSSHVEGEQLTTLEMQDQPNPATAAAPAPEDPVRVLVANNTVSRETSQNPADSRFATLADGIRAVTYQDSLTSTLASTGIAPETAGYSNVNYRYDATVDSTVARDINATSSIRLAVDEAATGEDEAAGNPVMINPPATWEAHTADAILGTVNELMDSGTAQPLTLEDYLTPEDEAALPLSNSTGTPFPDPTVITDAEILSAGQQANYADDVTAFLSHDSAIALTRYGYTLPLRRDLVTATSLTHRRSADLYAEATERTQARLNSTRDSLNEIRSAVDLIPPGNVYTRTSESSPLLIVAENGLPLPIDATILYEAPEGVTLNIPDDLSIPARGSITIQMTADIPNTRERTDLNLYLATPQGQPVSRPVQISVQTAAGEVGAISIGALLVLFLGLVLLFRTAKARRAKENSNQETDNSPGEKRTPDRPPD